MKKLLVQTLIILTVMSTGSGIAHASSTLIRSRISAVRIVVVNTHAQITEIYSNTDQTIPPEVRLGNSSGRKITLSKAVALQYANIEHNIPKGATGKVYERHPFPSLLQMLYAML